jgi:hypothetical protein
VKKVAEESGGEVHFVERTKLGGAGFEITLPAAVALSPPEFKGKPPGTEVRA